MGKLQKLLDRIKRNPKTVRFDEIDKLLQKAGFIRSQPGGGSSHYIYRKGKYKLVIPFRQPYILQSYVIRAIKLLEGADEDE